MQKDVATLAKASGDMKAVRAAQANVNKLMEYYDKISEGSGVKQEYGRMDGSTRIGRSVKAAPKANKGVPELTFGATGNIITPEEAEQKLREYIKTDSVNKTVNPEKQSRHIKDSAGYIAGRSYILGGIEAAQELVNKYHGTGIPKLTRKGEWNGKEFIAADHIIGVDVDKETGKETQTNRFHIHYSGTGVHIVPTKRGR